LRYVNRRPWESRLGLINYKRLSLDLHAVPFPRHQGVVLNVKHLKVTLGWVTTILTRSQRVCSDLVQCGLSSTYEREDTVAMMDLPAS